MPRVHSLQIEDVHSKSSLENDVTGSQEANRNENVTEQSDRLRQELSLKLGPIMRCLKITGNYSGETSLDELLQVKSSNWFSRFYCGIVLLGQWTLVVQTVVSLFVEGLTEMQSFYFLLMFSIWYLQCAAFTTISLFTLSKRLKKPSRFSQFISSLITTATAGIGARRQTVKKILTVVCCFAVFNSSCLVLLDFHQQSSVARFRPWDGLIAYRLIHLLFGVFDSFALMLPFLLFCVSCVFLIDIFETLHKKLCTENTTFLKIATMRREHQNLCETVALADKVFAPFLFIVVSCNIPLICINFHQVTRSASSNKENVAFVVSVLYWFMGMVAQLVIAMMFGIRVNEKVSFFISIYFHYVSSLE